MRTLVDLLANDRLVVAGTEHLVGLPRDRGILLAPNHRSFFDLFVAARVAYGVIGSCRRLYFPVRSNFWYDSVVGLAVKGIDKRTPTQHFAARLRAIAARQNATAIAGCLRLSLRQRHSEHPRTLGGGHLGRSRALRRA